MMLFSGGGLRARWDEFFGPTPWLDCEEVSVDGPFVVINTGTRLIVVPDHVIRKSLEVEPRPNGDDR